MVQELSGLEELEDLYTTYLKQICPNWQDERIKTEIRDVFNEQGLISSRWRRQKFRDSLLQKLDRIRQNPDDWFLNDSPC